MEFRILGRVEGVGGDDILPLGGPQPRRLLAMLLVDANRPCSHDRLIEAVWCAAPPAAALRRLRVLVSRLRRVLDQAGQPTRFRTLRGAYVLTVGEDELDAWRFERLLESAQHELARNEARVALARIEDALSLWRGPAVADLAEFGVAVEEATRLEELRVLAEETRFEALLALARPETVVAELGCLLGLYPLRERLWGLQMLALYRSGRRAEALAVCGRLRSHLREEVGLDLSADMQDLEIAILREELLVLPARSLAQRMWTEQVLQAISRERQLKGTQAPAPRLADVPPLLTHREQEVCGLLATAHQSNREIAARLGVTMRTEEDHLPTTHANSA